MKGVHFYCTNVLSKHDKRNKARLNYMMVNEKTIGERYPNALLGERLYIWRHYLADPCTL